MAWETSTRRQRLPSDWPERVAAVKRRANSKCEASHHVDGCNGKGQEVDHRHQGDDHRVTNLQYLSTECHAVKTRAENAARNRLHAQLKRRPQEQHPGVRA